MHSAVLFILLLFFSIKRTPLHHFFNSKACGLKCLGPCPEGRGANYPWRDFLVVTDRGCALALVLGMAHGHDSSCLALGMAPVLMALAETPRPQAPLLLWAPWAATGGSVLSLALGGLDCRGLRTPVRPHSVPRHSEGRLGELPGWGHQAARTRSTQTSGPASGHGLACAQESRSREGRERGLPLGRKGEGAAAEMQDKGGGAEQTPGPRASLDWEQLQGGPHARNTEGPQLRVLGWSGYTCTGACWG